MTRHPFAGGSVENKTAEPSGGIDPYEAVLLLFDEAASVAGSSSSYERVNDNNTSAGDRVRAVVTRIFNDTSDYDFPSVRSVLDGVGVDVVTDSVDDGDDTPDGDDIDGLNNWWAMLALVLVVGTAAGNILVCLAIAWERRLQNVTNYFLMSLAVTDLMVAVLVMPLGILTLVRGKIGIVNQTVHSFTRARLRPFRFSPLCVIVLTPRDFLQCEVMILMNE